MCSLHPIGKHNDEIYREILTTKAIELVVYFLMVCLDVIIFVEIFSFINWCIETCDKDCRNQESSHYEQYIQSPMIVTVSVTRGAR